MSKVVNFSPGSSLEPIEDRFSIVLSRLERIEASLSALKDVKKLLVEIEDNTHPDGDNKCDFRQNALEKVGFEIIINKFFAIVLSCLCMSKALLRKKRGVKCPHITHVNFFRTVFHSSHLSLVAITWKT